MTRIESAPEQDESPPDPAAAADEARVGRGARRPRRRTRLLVTLPIVVVAGFILASDPMATAAADHLAPSTLGRCARLRDPSVSFGSWPRLFHAATGQVHHLRVTAKELDIGNFSIHDLQVKADRARFSQFGIFTGSPSLDIEGGTATLTTTADDLNSYLQRMGVPAMVQASSAGLTLNATALGLVSWSSPLVFSAQNGALVVAPSFGTGFIPALASDLFRRSIAVQGAWIQSVREVPGAVHVVVDFGGNPAALACSAHEAIG